MHDVSICFEADLSIGLFLVADKRLLRINKVNKRHPIFDNIKAPFDWYFKNNILIIPDPVPIASANWDNQVTFLGQNIECPGEFVAFFHYEQKRADGLIASALTLPEYDYVKSALAVNNV